MKILIGNTGLIGNNLKEKIKFDFEFNSSNINQIVHCPNECDLYLSCLPATKWKINKNIVGDLTNIKNIIAVISKKKYNKVFLFSTIDVYSDSPLHVNEDYNPNFSDLNYGSNRLLFESLIKNFLSYKNYYIFRLPALFGKFLKKNIIYDILNNNRIHDINLNSYYQWYNLEDLVDDINRLSAESIKFDIFNLFPEPVHTEKLIKNIFPELHLENKKDLIQYDWKTKFSDTGYLYDKNYTLSKIEKFVHEIRNQ